MGRRWPPATGTPRLGGGKQRNMHNGTGMGVVAGGGALPPLVLLPAAPPGPMPRQAGEGWPMMSADR